MCSVFKIFSTDICCIKYVCILAMRYVIYIYIYIYDISRLTFKIRQVGEMTEQTIYEVTCPYCRGELLSIVTNAREVKESFYIFNAQLLRQLTALRYIAQL
jgi:hypothetical protein